MNDVRFPDSGSYLPPMALTLLVELSRGISLTSMIATNAFGNRGLLVPQGQTRDGL